MDNLFDLKISNELDFSVVVDSIVVWILLGIFAAILMLKLVKALRGGFRDYEIDAAEFGIGDQKIKLRPNDTDRQIAYKIWVELSTRKIGLPIDLNDDVLVEIYDSWHNFFSVTRELIKDVPVSKFRRQDTEKIVRLSIDVLNTGIRPHLTKWQARFRHWYNRKLEAVGDDDVSPQDLQRTYTRFDELEAELEEVNARLISYREKMHQLVAGR